MYTLALMCKYVMNYDLLHLIQLITSSFIHTNKQIQVDTCGGYLTYFFFPHIHLSNICI